MSLVPSSPAARSQNRRPAGPPGARRCRRRPPSAPLCPPPGSIDLTGNGDSGLFVRLGCDRSTTALRGVGGEKAAPASVRGQFGDGPRRLTDRSLPRLHAGPAVSVNAGGYLRATRPPRAG